ncbi:MULTISPECIES: DegT/DnrJ/EryC1/StrS family aminotransferase [Anaeromyxobacter]|uniref:DegT/DnrJ/EryC1/StrS family aminotransferase n=1 Tax=Anaeromyxobacter TaxID=161492 RepID=UPI001F55BC13|nr:MULTISPECIES: DegT/DnrJ/EryC1/StrS family aminotransferase [unclassified Anaeromyxobacter]
MRAANFLPFALPDISEAEVESVVETLRSGWITTGPKTKEFERRFGAATGAPHAVMVNSCTAALHLALEAVGVKAGDEVIVPTLTFAATAEVVRYLGATPVLVDVRGSDHNVDPAAIERAITPRTRAIMPVHFAGVPADMDEIVALARPRGIFVIDDAAHCFPGRYRGRKVGTLADISCFSFYATKTITTGEGGAAVTANAEWADRMRFMSLHGISRDAWKRYSAEGSWYYEIIAPGYKYNLTDIASAIGLGQLERADEMLERRREIAVTYDRAFIDHRAFELMSWSTDRDHTHHLYVLKLRPGALGIDRDRFIVELKERGIGASVHFIPLHVHPYYRDTYGYAPEQLPVALDVYRRSVSLPIYSKMTDGDVARVVEAVTDIASKHRRSGGRHRFEAA